MQSTQQTNLAWSQLALLNPRAEQRLRRRITDADGNIYTVIQDLSERLRHLDQQPFADDVDVRTQQQADRAFYVAEISYLTTLAQGDQAPTAPTRRGVIARLRSAFGRA